MTFPADVPQRLSRAKSLPEAIRILREAAGSHDRLAVELGTRRQRVILWEQGEYPSRYVEKLKELGVPGRLFSRVSRDEVEARLREIEAEVAALRDLIRE